MVGLNALMGKEFIRLTIERGTWIRECPYGALRVVGTKWGGGGGIGCKIGWISTVWYVGSVSTDRSPYGEGGDVKQNRRMVETFTK